eukprot:605718-Rhodomonas_salina.2
MPGTGIPYAARIVLRTGYAMSCTDVPYAACIVPHSASYSPVLCLVLTSCLVLPVDVSTLATPGKPPPPKLD